MTTIEKPKNPEFQVAKLNPKGLDRANEITNRFDALLDWLRGEIPEGRQLSIVKNNLEDACMHARKALATVPLLVEGQAIATTAGR